MIKENELAVLVVEDVDWIRCGMKSSLEREGFHVTEATDDREALSIAERVHPNLILTEEDLPTFFELTRRIRRHPDLTRVPIVIVNPDAEENSRYGDAIILSHFDQLRPFLFSLKKTSRSDK